MVKMVVEPENKLKYIKLSKHLLVASVFITLALSLVELPKNYYGSKIEIVDPKIAEPTIEKIRDDDCQGRECVYVENRWCVVTDRDVSIRFYGELTLCDKFGTYTNYENLPYEELGNVDVLRRFSECQGFFKGYYADILYYRDSDDFIFPADYNYEQYTNAKQEYLNNLEATQNE